MTLAGGVAMMLAAAPQTAPAARPDAPALRADSPAWSAELWSAARGGQDERFRELLASGAESLENPLLAQSAADLVAALEGRDKAKADLEAEERQAMDEAMEAYRAAQTPLEAEQALLDGLGSAITLHMLSERPEAVLGEQAVVEVVAAADAAARQAEEAGRWFAAAELFDRLHGLYEFDGRYIDDRRRQLKRLSLIATYAPERNHALRSERLEATGKDPLPPYNPATVSVEEKLDGVRADMVRYALAFADARHVEGGGYRKLLAAGLRGLALLATTEDLRERYPSLADEAARERFRTAIGERLEDLEQDRRVDQRDMLGLVEWVQRVNRGTVGLPEEMVLRVFGTAAMRSLDEYTEIIWPDDVRQFERSTRGNFSGIGVSIHMHKGEVQVVTPLDGTPAQRAGVRAEDVIVKVDGEPTLGFTLNDAVDKITGPKGTPVDITVRRGDGDEQRELTFTIVRDTVELKTVKGWERLDATDDHWDWMIDPAHGIGYVRLTGFTENTTADFDRALAEMDELGLQGLILDLRFNRGGLLDQAVEITSRFVDYMDAQDSYGRVVVSTRNARGSNDMAPERLMRRRSPLPDLPVVVLVNEGSASASEIVAGAIQDYTRASASNAVVLGQTTYGKGSVQNVLSIDRGPSPKALMKLTTQYYILPGGRMIHRQPGQAEHGVEPDLPVLMLPEQVADSLMLRQEADVLVLDENGNPPPEDERPDPDALISDGLDVQLHAALVLLQSQSEPSPGAAAMLPADGGEGRP